MFFFLFLLSCHFERGRSKELRVVEEVRKRRKEVYVARIKEAKDLLLCCFCFFLENLKAREELRYVSAFRLVL